MPSLLRAFLNIVAALGCFGVGFYAAHRLRRRVEVLRDLKWCLSSMEMQMGFAATECAESIENAAKRCRVREVGVLLKRIAARIRDLDGSMHRIWDEEIKRAKNAGLDCLTDGDREILLRFALGLGSTDMQRQSMNFSLAVGQLEEEIAAVSADASRKSRLYVTLGVLAGLAILVVLI